MTRLEITGLHCGHGREPVLRDISFNVEDAEILMILGPNGIGKSTLFKTILGLVPAHGGSIRLNGRNLPDISIADRARQIGYVPQAHSLPFPFRVIELVAMGLAARLGIFQTPSARHIRHAGESLERLGISALAHRPFNQLSGGQQQLVLIARAITQRPDVLMLDEPTANLDLGNVSRVLRQILELAGQGLSIVMTSHDPDHAFLYEQAHPNCRVAVLQPGGGLRHGAAHAVLTEACLRETYGTDIPLGRALNAQGQPIRFCIPSL